jgi:GNAT superfamily N-acetyltransferase
MMLHSSGMAKLMIIPGAELPEAYAHQIRSFIRLHWHDEYLFDLDAPLVPEDRQPIHVIVGERHALFSHARVSRVEFSHRGETYRLYSLGDVFTYPAFRGRGFGSRVTAAATQCIHADAQSDLALLFCDPGHAAFYRRYGWEAVPDLVVLRGFDGEREPQPGLPMMLWRSTRGQENRPERHGPFELPGYGW